MSELQTLILDAVRTANAENLEARMIVYRDQLVQYEALARSSDTHSPQLVRDEFIAAIRTVEENIRMNEQLQTPVVEPPNVSTQPDLESIEPPKSRGIIGKILLMSLIAVAVLSALYFYLPTSSQTNATSAWEVGSDGAYNLDLSQNSIMTSIKGIGGSQEEKAKVIFTDGILRIAGPQTLYVKEPIEVDLSVPYEFVVELRAVAGDKSVPTWAGIAAYDGQLSPLFKVDFRYAIKERTLPVDGEWKIWRGDIAKTGTGHNTFPEQTKFARPAFFFNYKMKSAVTEIRKITLRKKPAQ